MTPFSWGLLDLAPLRAAAAPSAHSSTHRRFQRYFGPATLLSRTGQELGEVLVALDKHSRAGKPPSWDGLVETADKSPIDRLLRRRTEGTLMLPDGRTGTVWIRRLTAHSPIAGLIGSGEPPF